MSLKMESRPTASAVLPDLKLDRCLIGFTGSVRSPSVPSPFKLAELIAPFAPVTTPASRRSDRYVQISVPLLSEAREHEVGTARVDLHFEFADGALRLTERTALEVNPQKVLRNLKGGDATFGPPGYDGNSNVLGPNPHGPALARELVELASEAAGFVFDMLMALLPRAEWQPGNVWLKAVEACRDLEVPDSVAAMRRVQQTTLLGATSSIRGAYRSELLDGNRVIAVQWFDCAGGPAKKAYAKRRDTLRIELACRDREAVAKVTTRASLPLSRTSVRSLLEAFLGDAASDVEGIEEHIRSALTGCPSPVEIGVRLARLVWMAAGHSSGRGPSPSPSSIQTARDALEGFYAVGMYDAGGIPGEHAVRRVLDELCADDGPLTRDRRKTIYFLHAAREGISRLA